MMRPTPRHRALAFLAVALLIVVSCLGDPTGPSARTGGLALAPRYEHAMAAAIVDVSAVRVKLNRPGNTADVVVDTVIQFPVGKDTIELRLEIPLERSSEQFEMRLAMTNAQGDTVFRAGPITVTATTGNDNAPAEPTFTYVGVGANAAGVRFIEPPASVPFGATVTLQAEAFDGQQNAIAGTPIGFELVNLSDTVRARITDTRAGTFVARTQRGNVQVRAKLASGQSATHTIAVQPVANGIVTVSGNNQSGPVGQALSAPLVARVAAADELGVQGVEVAWNVIIGVDTLEAVLDTSDANGLVQFTPALPEAAGSHEVLVSLTADPDISTSFTMTAVAAAPAQLAFLTEPTDNEAAQPFDPVVQVAVQDAQGNVNPDATNVVTLDLFMGGEPVAGALSGTLSVAAVNGIATFTDLAVLPAGTEYQLRASAGVLNAALSAEFAVSAGAAVALVYETQPPAGAVFGQPFTVRVQAHDAGGNPVQIGDQITIALGANPGGATLGGTLSVSMGEAVAHFGDLTLDALGTGYTLVASAPGLTSATSNAFDVTQPPEVNAWINPSGGTWSTAANWSLGTVPTVNDTVWIKLPGTYTVTVDQATSVGRVEVGGASGTQRLDVQSTLTLSDTVVVLGSAQLHLLAGAITGTGGMRVPGHFGWEGGNLTLSGTITVPGTMTIAGTTTRTFTSTVIELGGLGLWTNTHTINSGLGATWRVLPGANVDVQGDASWITNQGGTATLDVQGGLLRTTSTGTVVAPALAVGGTLTVMTGTFETRGAATSSGTLGAVAGATLAFGAGTHTLAAGSTVEGEGTIAVLTSAAVATSGAWSVDGTTRVDGAFDYNGPSGRTARLELFAGRHGGSGALDVTEHLEWEAGDINGGGGTTRVFPGATIQIAGNTTRSFINHVLSIGGAGSWSGAPNFNSGLGAILRIEAGGELDIDGTPNLQANQGGVTLTEVQGLLRKSAAGTATLEGLAVTGIVQVEAGALVAEGTATSAGTITVAQNALLTFQAGTQTLVAGSSVTGDGMVQVTTGGIVTTAGFWSVDGTTQVTNGQFVFNGSGHTGTLLLDGNGSRRGAGTLLVNTLLQWNSGDFAADGGVTRVQPGANLLISGLSNRLFNAQVIEVAGTGDWAGNHTIFTGQGAVLRVLAGGQLAITGNGQMSNNQGGAQTITDVQGTLTRTTSTGQASIVGLSVRGSLSVETGVLEVRDDGLSSGALTVLAGAELRFAGGANALDASSSVDGAGLVFFASGTVTSAGGWGVTGTTRVVGGSLILNGPAATMGLLDLSGPGSVGGTAPLSVTGGMTWTGGVVETGNGTIRIEPGATFSSSGTNVRVLRAHSIEIAGAGVMAGTHTLFSGLGDTLRVVPGGTLDVQGDITLNPNQGGAQSVLLNDGAITRSTSAGSWQIGSRFVNRGSLSVTTGSLTLVGGGEIGGSVATATATTFALTGGAYALADELIATGAGDFLLNGGTVTGAAADTASIERLRLSGGVLAHAGTVLVPGRLLWEGSTAIEGGGTTRVEPGALLDIINGTSRVLRGGATLENVGTATWTGDASIFTGLGARILNRAGATFNWAGNGDLVDNQGAPQATFVNEGSFQHNGDGIAGVGAFVIDTVGTEFRIENTAGEMQLAGGGRFGGAGDKYTGGDLVVTGSGTVSLQGGSQWNADGGYIRLDGGTLTIDSAQTVNVTAIDMRSGTLRHEGTLRIGGEFLWSGGTIGSDASLPGGRTEFVGANVQVLGTAAKLLRDNHRLVVPTGVTVQFGGSGNLNAGIGAVIENSGTWEFDGTAQMLANQGGEARFINAAGATLVAGATTPAIMNFVLENSGGHLQAAGDTLVLGGGSATAFAGTAEATGGYAVRLQGGVTPFTLTGPLSTNGDLHVASGAFDVGGTTGTINGNLTVTGGGRVDMTQVAAVLDVNGNVSFGGATGTMSAGRMNVSGDFAQLGGGTSFVASGLHVTRFDGTGEQLISFVSPGAGLSRFQGVEVLAGVGLADSIALASDAYTMGNLTVQTGKIGKVPPHRFVVAGDAGVAVGAGGSGLRPFVLEVGGTVNNSAIGVTPDTLVLNRAGAYAYNTVPSGIVHQRFRNGQVGFQPNSAPGDLIADNGASLTFSGITTVSGNLETRSSGIIVQNVGASNVTVLGNGVFNGGNTSGSLTAGRLQFNGNFTQLPGTSTASFAPTVNHVTAFGGQTPATISFVTPTLSQFDSLIVDKGQTGTRYPVTLLSDVRVTGGMFVRGGTDITGPNARISITGGTLQTVQQTMSPTMTSLRALELSVAPTQIGATVSPDTTVLNAGITALPVFPALQYRSIRVNTGGGVTFTTDTILGDLDIANGTVAFGGTANFRVNGNLTTRNAGTLLMLSTDANLAVVGNARFLGGSTAGGMNAGVLRLFGSFEQGGNGASFQASGTHRTEFMGAGHNVMFAAPGTAANQSRFNQLWLSRTNAATQLLLNSDVNAAVVVDTNNAFSDSFTSAAGARLTVGRADLGVTTFDRVTLTTTDGGVTSNYFGLTFQNMDPTTSYLTIFRNEGFGASLNLVNFIGPVPTTGFYVDVQQVGNIQSSVISFTNSSPASLAGRYRLQASNSGGASLPLLQWNGVFQP